MLFFRTLLFYLSYIVIIPISILLSLLSHLLRLPVKKRYQILRFSCVCGLWWLKITCNLKHTIKGLENIPGDDASILMSNHQSQWETIALPTLAVATPQTWVLKHELLYVPIYNLLLLLHQPIFFKRHLGVQAMRKLVREGTQHLGQKTWVLIFPEGTRVQYGEKKEYLPGGGMLARKSGAKIVPIAHNSGAFWIRGKFFIKAGTIEVVIGPPISPKNKTAKEITNEAQNWIEAEIKKFPPPTFSCADSN